MLTAADGVLQDPFVLYHHVARCSALFEYYLFVWDDNFRVEREMAASLYKLRTMKDSTVEYRPLKIFVETWNELLHRTTSFKSDLLIIFALISDPSIYGVEEDVTQQRRRLVILKTQDKLYWYNV